MAKVDDIQHLCDSLSSANQHQTNSLLIFSYLHFATSSANNPSLGHTGDVQVYYLLPVVRACRDHILALLVTLLPDEHAAAARPRVLPKMPGLGAQFAGADVGEEPPPGLRAALCLARPVCPEFVPEPSGIHGEQRTSGPGPRPGIEPEFGSKSETRSTIIR